MPMRKFPLTRRDRFRLYQIRPESTQAKDNNQNETETKSETGHDGGTDETDHCFIVSTNSANEDKGLSVHRNSSSDSTTIELLPYKSVDHKGDKMNRNNNDKVNPNSDDEEYLNHERRPLAAAAAAEPEDDIDAATPTRIGINDEEAEIPGLIDILGYLVGIFFFTYDIWTDCHLAYSYYIASEAWWFGLTALFIVLPMAIMTSFNFCFYLMDMFVVKESVSCFRWFLRALFTILMLGPFIRMFETLDYALRSYCSRDTQKKRVYANKFIDAEVDSSLIGLLEAFMEAGPQVVLQLCVFEVMGWTEDTTHLVTHQLRSIVSSMWMLSWSLVRFQKAIIKSQTRQDSSGACHSIIKFLQDSVFLSLWRLCTISSRVLVLSTFAACFSWYIGPVCLGHFIIMLIWLCCQDTGYFKYVGEDGKIRHDCCLEVVFKIFAAFVYIFDYLNLLGGRVRLRAVFYYAIIYVENCVLIGMWYMYGQCSSMGPLGYIIVLFIVVVGFWIGMAFMGIHYMCCHQNRKSVKCCVPCSELKLCSETEMQDTPTRAEGKEERV